MAAHSLTFFLWEEVTMCPSLESRWALGLLDQESTTVPASELGPWDSDHFYFPSIGWAPRRSWHETVSCPSEFPADGQHQLAKHMSELPWSGSSSLQGASSAESAWSREGASPRSQVHGQNKCSLLFEAARCLSGLSHGNRESKERTRY